MASVLLARHLNTCGLHAEVISAGTSPATCTPGASMVAASTRALVKLGIDPTPHRSQLLTADLVTSADLVLAMAREHLREAVALVPGAWPRTYTLKEFVRLGRSHGARRTIEPIATWLASIGEDRVRAHALETSPDDDVADPTGRPISAHVRTARELDELTFEAASLIAGVGP